MKKFGFKKINNVGYYKAFVATDNVWCPDEDGFGGEFKTKITSDFGWTNNNDLYVKIDYQEEDKVKLKLILTSGYEQDLNLKYHIVHQKTLKKHPTENDKNQLIKEFLYNQYRYK